LKIGAVCNGHKLRLEGVVGQSSGEGIRTWLQSRFGYFEGMAVKLTGHQVEVVLSTLDGWIQAGAKIRREYKFSDFVAAAMFVTGVNLEAEKMNHHPELWHQFNTVKIELTTHDVEGVSELDLRLAKKLDARARTLSEKG
jgi:4a-hydroxytetrahydrobiopterin dehydratase